MRMEVWKRPAPVAGGVDAAGSESIVMDIRGPDRIAEEMFRRFGRSAARTAAGRTAIEAAESEPRDDRAEIDAVPARLVGASGLDTEIERLQRTLHAAAAEERALDDVAVLLAEAESVRLALLASLDRPAKERAALREDLVAIERRVTEIVAVKSFEGEPLLAEGAGIRSRAAGSTEHRERGLGLDRAETAERFQADVERRRHALREVVARDVVPRLNPLAAARTETAADRPVPTDPAGAEAVAARNRHDLVEEAARSRERPLPWLDTRDEARTLVLEAMATPTPVSVSA